VLTPPYFVEEGDCTPVLLFKKGNNNEELINKGNRTKEKIDINTIIGVISIFINFLGLLLEIFIK
jgi:hypothetical protein